jgi:hypothetical protein
MNLSDYTCWLIPLGKQVVLVSLVMVLSGINRLNPLTGVTTYLPIKNNGEHHMTRTKGY